MKMTAWVTIASLVMYIWTFSMVGRARGQYKVPAPLTDGPQEFLIALRVQANTVEQLVLFLPLLWMAAWYKDDQTAAVLGAIWVVGRVLYALGYYSAPSKRSAGFMISSFASAGLLISACIGLLH